MKYKDIQELTTKELKDLLGEEKINLVKMKVVHTVTPLDNPLKIRETKRRMARIRTELRKRELNSK